MTIPYSERYRPCPICDYTAEVLDRKKEYEGEDFTIYKCDYCGYIGCQNDNKYFEGFNISLYDLAGYLYENNRNVFYVTPKNCNDLLDTIPFPKCASDYLDKICLNLYNRGSKYLRAISVDYVRPSFGYADSKQELTEMFQALIEMQYVKIFTEHILGDEPIDRDFYCLTINGLKHVESLLNTNKNSTTAFIAMRFTDEMRLVRDEAIKPAALTCGFDAFTVDEDEYLGDVTDRIISGIKTCRFVIADFTDNNLGVYYEAGYAKGLGIPVIKTCRKDWFDGKTKKKKNKLHFDIEHDNLILWESQGDLARKLEAKIRATIL